MRAVRVMKRQRAPRSHTSESSAGLPFLEQLAADHGQTLGGNWGYPDVHTWGNSGKDG